MIRKVLVATALLVASPALAAPASVFLRNAIMGDNSEIRLGGLIAARGSTGQVRSFGRTLSRDHSSARADASSVARSMGIRPPTAMMPEARAAYSRLSRLRGRSFDREARRYMINDHRKDIADFSRQTRVGDRQTAALARRQLPTLRKHLSMAQAIRA